jgi:leader peptidase (prepilin peptidase)/N-methyltransferase
MHALTTHPRNPAAAATVVVLTSAVAVSIAIVFPGAGAFVVVALLAPAAAAAIVDARDGRIPDRLVVLVALPPLLAVIVGAATGRAEAISGATLLGAALFALPLLLTHLLASDAMGFGDVKLAAALGAGLGLIDPRASIVALCIASAATATVGVYLRRASLPFGPGMVVGTSACVVVAAAVDERWWSWR